MCPLDGIDEELLRSLSDAQRLTILTVLARVSERSYRRGVQQGATIAKNRPGDLPADLHEWRYGVSLDISPWADAPRAQTSIGRLFTETRELRRFGFTERRQDSDVFAWHPTAENAKISVGK